VTTKRTELAKLRRVYDPEMLEYAKQFFPDRARETEAQRIERERQEAERTGIVLAMRDTRDAVLGGQYGKEARDKAREYAIANGKDSLATLRYCSRLAAKIRTSEYYKRLNAERRRED
jgi:hypothetical protein